MPNTSTELRHAAARRCIRGALDVLWPAQGPRANACRAHLEQALAALGEPGAAGSAAEIRALLGPDDETRPPQATA